MPWFQVDDQLSFHPKAVAAGNAALGLWVRAGSWCALHMTGGFIPRDIARSMGSPAQIKKLLDVVLWTDEEDGYQFHQWGDRQLSKEEIEERRRKRAEAGRRGGQRSGETRRTGSKNEASASAFAQASVEATAEANAAPSAEAEAKQELQQKRTPVPVLVPGSGSFGEESLVANARENEPPPENCPAHPHGTMTPCRACGAARRERDEWQAAQRRAEAERVRADRAACDLCDDAGWRIPPSELDDEDPPAARCDHAPGMPAAWRALIAELLTRATEETNTHA